MSDVFIRAQGNKIPVSNYLFYLTHSRRSDYIDNSNTDIETDNSLQFVNYNIIKYVIDFFRKRKKEPLFDPNKFTEVVVALPKDVSKDLIKYKDTFHFIVNDFFERYFFKRLGGEHFLNFLHTKDSTGYKLHTHVLLYPFTSLNNKRVHIKHFKSHIELEELKEELRAFIKKPDSFKPLLGEGRLYRFDKKREISIKKNFLNEEDNIEVLTKDVIKMLEEEIKLNGILKLKNLNDIEKILDIFEKKYYLARKNNAFLSLLMSYCNNIDILKRSIELFSKINPLTEINLFLMNEAKNRLNMVKEMFHQQNNVYSKNINSI